MRLENYLDKRYECRADEIKRGDLRKTTSTDSFELEKGPNYWRFAYLWFASRTQGALAALGLGRREIRLNTRTTTLPLLHSLPAGPSGLQ